MVADETADLRLAGRDRIALERHEDLAVVVAQVAVGSDRAEVDPLADVGVTQESLVILIGMAVHDGVLDLAADPADWPDRHAAAEVGPEQLGIGRRSEQGPSIRVNGWTQTFGPNVIGPLVVSKTV